MSNQKRIAILSSAIAILFVAGIASAAWLANGTGSGTAKATTALALQTTAVGVTTADLYPGKTTGGLSIRIDNPNPYQVTVTQISSAAGAVTGTGGTGTCTATGVSLNSPLTVSIVVPGNGNSGTVLVPSAVSMSNASDDGCQGATFTIPVSVSGASS